MQTRAGVSSQPRTVDCAEPVERARWQQTLPDTTMQDLPASLVDRAIGMNNQEDVSGDRRDLDAFGTATQHARDQDHLQDALLRPQPSVPNLPFEQVSARDESLLRSLVFLRLLTYSQIHRLIFSSVDPSFARRRIRQLAKTGWLNTWEPPSRSGGHVRFAHPTQRTLRHVLPAIDTSPAWARTVHLMLPRTKRRPLQLGDVIPKWLPHQREVNELVLSMLNTRRDSILWCSTWDSPFPARLGMFTSPQPDYVLVEAIDGQPHLVFGEHDRASEPIERFVARKISLYRALAKFPEACEQHFGFRDFTVQVTVTDPHHRAPIRRLRNLIDASRRYGGPDVFRFTLGGWLHAYPSDRIWWDVATPPAHDSVAFFDHAPGPLTSGVIPPSGV